MMTILEICSTVVSLSAGAIIALAPSQYIKYSMVLWLIGSVLWMYYSYINQLMGLMIVSSCYIVIEAAGLIKHWRK